MLRMCRRAVRAAAAKAFPPPLSPSVSRPCRTGTGGPPGVFLPPSVPSNGDCMSRALSAVRAGLLRGLPARSPAAPPTAGQLAALGTVLCLYRADQNELAGWQDAVAVHACQGLDSDGVHESLCFTDAHGDCCWRLYLLPESDFLAWDRLVAGLSTRTASSDDANVGERLWRRLAGSLGGRRWRMCAARLHAIGQGRSLAASLAPLSSLGAATARRIARLEGVDGVDAQRPTLHA